MFTSVRVYSEIDDLKWISVQAYPTPTVLSSPAFAAAAGLGLTPASALSAAPGPAVPLAPIGAPIGWRPAVSAASAGNEDLPASAASAATQRMPSQDQAFERIGAAVRLNLEQLKGSIEQARNESSQFFKLTLIFAGLGFLVVVSGVALLLAQQVAGAIVTSISGLIPEVTAVLFF